MEHGQIIVAAIAAVFFVAGIVKGITGMGLPTVAMGVLSAFLPPLSAATLLLVPSFIANIWQLGAGPRLGSLVRRLWPMMVAIIVGTMAGTGWLTGGDTGRTTLALGLALLVYALYTLFARQLRVPPGWEDWLSPMVGLATGIVSGATGVFVIPAVPYLQALDFERDELVQALGLSFTVSTIALAAGLFWRGALVSGELISSLLAVIPALAGVVAGQAIRTRLSPPMFRRGFLAFLALLGLEMALRTSL